MQHIKIALFSLLTLSTVLTNNLVGQTWSENFNSSTNFASYVSKGYSFTSNCTGTNCYTIGTTPRTVAGWGNSLQLPYSGTNLFNYTFTTGYMNLTGSSSISFSWDQHNNSHEVNYSVNLIDSGGNVTNVVIAGNKGNGNSGTVTTNFTQSGWYRVQFIFSKTQSTNNSNTHFAIDNFTSNITDNYPFLVNVDTECDLGLIFNSSGSIDTLVYETTALNSGPDTLLSGTNLEFLVELPNSPLMTFDQIELPANSTLDTATGFPNTAIWRLNSLPVGQPKSLRVKSFFNNSQYNNLPIQAQLNSQGFNGSGSPFNLNFSGDTCECSVIMLPVKISSFTVELNQNKLPIIKWITVAEENNSGFEILSSDNGITWISKDFIEGVGNSFETNEYSYIDNEPLTQTRFYKLVQVDYNGKKEEFGPIRIDIDNRFLNKNLTVFPNPSNGIVNIKLINNHAVSKLENTEVSVFSITGQIVYKISLDYTTTNNQSIDLSHLPKGQYILKLSNNDQVHSIKIIIE